MFQTPQDAEDAYYDAVEACDLEQMMAVWENSPEAHCLLPMQPMLQGPRALRSAWSGLLKEALRVEVTVHSLQWIEQGELAIHLVEEAVTVAAQPNQPYPPIYATNIYRKGAGGWRLLVHLNAPAPPPPGAAPPGMPGG